MINLRQETVYVLDMFDHSTPSLDGLAEEVYGHKYVGQQTGDMIDNDTDIRITMDESFVEERIADGDHGYKPKPDRYDEIYGKRFPSGTILPWQEWLDLDPAEFKYDFEHYRLAPMWDCMLAHLIKDGHLPYGEYLIRVSW